MFLKLFFLTITFFLVQSAAVAQQFNAASCPPLLLLGLDNSSRQSIRCGTLNVPEMRGNDSSEQLELAVMILASSKASPADPVVFLQGGPGGASLATLDWWLSSPIRQNHDIILFDQRGTGYSRPNLSCFELALSNNPVTAMRACRNRLERSGINLSAYNSRESALDLQDLRKALNLEAVNLLGVSYGSRLALTIMRDQPEGIRSVILDSVYPPQARRMVEFAGNLERVFETVFAECEAQTACVDSYPNLRETFVATLERFNRDPMANPLLPLDGDLLLGVFFQAMYQTSLVPYLPYSMYKLSEGDVLTSLAVLSGISPEDASSSQLTLLSFLRILAESLRWLFINVQSEGVYFSTECQEDVLFQSLREVRQQRVRTRVFYNFSVDGADIQLRICDAWGTARSSRIESQAVSSSIPTLLLAGTFDPITPPAWAERAAKTLDNSTLVILPGVAHGAFDANDCVAQIVLEFLADPTDQPDTSCVASLDVSFYIP